MLTLRDLLRQSESSHGIEAWSSHCLRSSVLRIYSSEITELRLNHGRISHDHFKPNAKAEEREASPQADR